MNNENQESKGIVKAFFRRLGAWRAQLPWNREPLDPEFVLRAKAHIYGAGAGSAIRPQENGKMHVTVVKDSEEQA